MMIVWLFHILRNNLMTDSISLLSLSLSTINSQKREIAISHTTSTLDHLMGN
jgi:hypothetical protein